MNIFNEILKEDNHICIQKEILNKERYKIVDYIHLSLLYIYDSNKLFELYCVKFKEQLKNKYKGDYYFV